MRKWITAPNKGCWKRVYSLIINKQDSQRFMTTCCFMLCCCLLSSVMCVCVLLKRGFLLSLPLAYFFILSFSFVALLVCSFGDVCCTRPMRIEKKPLQLFFLLLLFPNQNEILQTYFYVPYRMIRSFIYSKVCICACTFCSDALHIQKWNARPWSYCTTYNKQTQTKAHI